MKNYLNILIITVAGLCFSNSYAQLLEEDSKKQITLAEGLVVTFAKKVSGYDSTEEAYFYLPVNLTFSMGKKGVPEFSWLTYREGNEISGGVLHFLVRWGLDKNQLKEADSLLKSALGEDILLMGGVMPEASFTQQKIAIEGTSKLAKILQNSKATFGKTALLPNTKMAASFHMNANDAEDFELLLNNDDELTKTFLIVSFQLKFRKPNQPGVHMTPYILKTNFKELLNQ
ncbi:hypothetical protein ACJD0Z_01940 [Flavobacteriaceae bacterium M23B6Z8]